MTVRLDRDEMASGLHDPVAAVDPATVEILRYALGSAAEQMKRALVRTAFSPMIYEVLDFAVGICNHRMEMLAQAPTLPMFMGTLGSCVEAGLRAIGGAEALAPGDTVLFNDPYGTGAHPNDAALLTPIFVDDTIFGYAVVKAHWLDIGGKDPYSTDTTDVFQEGTIYPGVKLFAAGRRVEDIWRMVVANTRLPATVSGDVNAMCVSTAVGAREVERLVKRFGPDRFLAAGEEILNHGERVVRHFLSGIPDGDYEGHGVMDNNGVDDAKLPFKVGVSVTGAEVRIKFTEVPPAQPGPVNCPEASTVAAARVALMMVAGGGDPPSTGHFRPIEVETTPGTLFHPESPAPCYLYGWPAFQAIEAIYQALATALPGSVPACSGGDICGLQWWGTRENGDAWIDGAPHPIGQGASAYQDGLTTMHHGEAATRLTSIEVWEARNPWRFEKVELAADSGGAGRQRGGLGIDIHYGVLEDSFLTSTLERTTNSPWGLEGGLEGRPNSIRIRFPDGTVGEPFGKATRIFVPRGAVVELATGGGGGFGPPSQRALESVLSDLRDGYITEDFAQRYHPAVFDNAKRSGQTDGSEEDAERRGNDAGN